MTARQPAPPLACSATPGSSRSPTTSTSGTPAGLRNCSRSARTSGPATTGNGGRPSPGRTTGPRWPARDGAVRGNPDGRGDRGHPSTWIAEAEGMPWEPGRYATLVHETRGIVMSDLPAEIAGCLPFLDRAGRHRRCDGPDRRARPGHRPGVAAGQRRRQAHRRDRAGPRRDRDLDEPGRRVAHRMGRGSAASRPPGRPGPAGAWPGNG